MGTTRPVGSLQQRLLLRLILEGVLSDVMPEGYMDIQSRRLCGAATVHCMFMEATDEFLCVTSSVYDTPVAPIPALIGPLLYPT